MLKKLKLFRLDLKLFDGEGAPAGAGQAGAATTASNAGSSQSGNTQQEPVVMYGKPPVASAAQGEQNGQQQQENVNTKQETPEERQKKYESLIKEYKDLDEKRFQNVFDKRFKEYKTLESQVGKYTSLVDTLAAKYGKNDVDEIVRAIEQDESFWEEQALEAGMTVEQYREHVRVQRQNQELQRRLQEFETQKESGEIYNRWLNEAKEIQQTNPDFDLQNECTNPQFMQLIRNNVDLKTAYYVIHRDEIEAAKVKQAETNMISTIRANAVRPAENGTQTNPGITYKSDPSKFTKEDMEIIKKRVARGDRVVL